MERRERECVCVCARLGECVCLSMCQWGIVAAAACTCETVNCDNKPKSFFARTSTFLYALKSSLIMSTALFWMAQCRGVFPLLLAVYGHPFSTKNFAQSSRPLAAA